MRWSFLSRLAVLLALVSGSALAQQDPVYEAAKGMDERFRLDIGGFFQNFNTTVAFGDDGTPIELEREFDLGNQTTFRVDGWWRFGRHGFLQFGYRGWKRSIEEQLTFEIDFGDEVFEIGAEVEFSQRVHIADLYYGYSFINSGKLETGLILGVSALFNKLSLEASLLGPIGGVATIQEDSVTLPIPSFGAFVRVTILPRFFFEASGRGFPTVTIGDYRGSTLDLRGGATYFFTRNIGLGVKYQYARLKVTRADTPRLQLDYEYSGPMAHISVAF